MTGQSLEPDPNASTITAIPDPNSPQAGPEATTELVGFVVRGRRLIERLQIDDLDSLVMPDGRRLLPLLRILRTFKLDVTERAGVLQFTPEGVGEIELDLTKGQVRIKGQTQPIEILQAVSEITMKADIYVSPEDISKILDMELVWNTELYEYRVQLDRKLSIWRLPSGRSLSAIQTAYVEPDLPEVLPHAERSQKPLQLLEFDYRPSYNWRRRASGGPDSHVVSVGAPRETVWGNVLDGQYKVQISHPNRTWSNTDGWRWANDDPYIAEADWFEWVHRLPTAEFTVGDSSFGLSELVYPVFNATGVRINGLAGWSPEELKSDQSRLGLRRYFGRSHVFEGPAPIDATVELLINGRSVDVQNVLPEADAAPGMGIYRFEDIELPSGILNEITIVIRESNGNEIRVERSITGTPQLLPAGRTAYLGLAGTKREKSLEDKQSFDAGDFYGYIAGGRVLHGLTDRVTVGTTLAYEQDHYHRFLENDVFGSRPYPESSGQAGVILSYLPRDDLIISSDFAASGGEGQKDYDGTAARTRVEYLPKSNLSLDLDLLNLEPSYFDGTDLEVSDRRGGETGLSWKPFRKWTLEGGIGYVQDNLDGQLGDTTAVNYQNIGLSTTALPRSSLGARFHHLGVNTEDEPKFLTELGLRITLDSSLTLFGQMSLGDELSIEDNDQFLSRLRFRHAPRLLRPSQYWILRKSLDPSNAVSLIYNDLEADETLSLVHDLRIDAKSHPLRFRSEFIKEMLDKPDGKEYGFRTRGEFLLDPVGYNHLGVMGEYRHGDYSFLLYLNIKQIYSRYNRRLININESRIRTAYGAVHGKVFLDYNGNHLLDADEPGIPNVKVYLGQNLTVQTDKHGYYIFSAPPNASEVRVHLDPTTVPATYTVTHGAQTAKVYRDSLTEVNLSVTPLISVVGHVVATEANVAEPNAPDPNVPDVGTTVPDAADASDAPAATRPLSGVRVMLSDAQSDLLVTDSYTATDGSYYLGDVKPGRYKLRVDPKTLPAKHALAEQERIVVIEPTKEEFLEVEQPDFRATVQRKPKLLDEAPPADSPKQ